MAATIRDVAWAVGVSTSTVSRAVRTGRGAAAADAVLAAGVTAVFAYNDLVALGLLDTLGARGVMVPDRISVVGFDDIFLAELVSPALTTLRQPTQETGRVGVDLLLRLMADPYRIPDPAPAPAARLLVRASTGPAAD